MILTEVIWLITQLQLVDAHQLEQPLLIIMPVGEDMIGGFKPMKLLDAEPTPPLMLIVQLPNMPTIFPTIPLIALIFHQFIHILII